MSVKPVRWLTEPQIKTLRLLAASPLKGKFYWTGGTALAYFYLRHRYSYDIDLFSDTEVRYEEIVPFVQGLARKIKVKRIEEKRIFDRWDFFLHNGGILRIEFVHYSFENLKPRKKWHGIKVDSSTDMAANKTMALIDRHEPKDAFDVYFLIKKKLFSPLALTRLVKKKFGIDCSLSLFLSEALRGAQKLRNIQPLLSGNQKQKNGQIEEVVNYFEKESADLVKKMMR